VNLAYGALQHNFKRRSNQIASSDARTGRSRTPELEGADTNYAAATAACVTATFVPEAPLDVST
jgi:hypothetical protein